MKNKMFVLCLLVLSASIVKADEPAQTSPPAIQGTGLEPKCHTMIEFEANLKLDNEKAQASGAPLKTSPNSTNDIAACKALEATSVLIGKSLQAGADSIASVDKRVVCVQKAGYTLDFESCKKSLSMYNYVLAAEKMMQTQQTVRSKLNGKNLSQQVNEQTANGDGQTAAIKATIQNDKNLIEMNQEQAGMYALAVGSLGASVKAWPTDSSASKLCKKEDTTCLKSLEKAMSITKRDIIANDNAKAVLVAAIADFVSKGIAAGMSIAQLNNGINALNPRDKAAQDAQDVTLQKCAVNPSDLSCINTAHGTRVDGANTQPGSFGVGSTGSGNNDFSFGAGIGPAFGTPGAATNLKNGTTVASINSPFEDAAKEASGILNPAARANASVGGPTAGAGGGGGGAGGMGGGGSATLGNDLSGANGAQHDPDIKSSKGSGNYGSRGGGEKFAAIKGSSDSNPFASMFDTKANGNGIEEDRSIASASDGAASSLWDKVSRAHVKAVENKKIETKNLE